MKRESIEVLKERAARHGQEHVFAFLDSLRASERERLLEQVAGIDFERLEEQRRLLAAPAIEGAEATADLVPAETFPLRRDADLDRRAAEAEARGADVLAAGAVAPLVVAGGQGSRLGFDGPKGCYPVGPVSGRSLFEWHARGLLAAERGYGRELTWFVMTSPANDAATRRFFIDHDWFGLHRERVFLFPQAMQPALDSSGRIVMATRGSLFLAPDGHGGVFEALAASGGLELARRCGVQHFSYFQVDNPLARPLDPLFVGLHVGAGARMSSKVLRKRDPAEGLGAIGVSGGVTRCVEYSELSEELRQTRDRTGELLWAMGGIAMHLFERELAEELAGAGGPLSWHAARKRISGIDERGEPTELDGVKFERFVFDALPRSPWSVTLEVEREEQFSPLKNRTGLDSPESVRRDLCRLHARWVREAGLTLPPPEAGREPVVEVDPRLAGSAAELLRALPEPVPRRTERGWIYEYEE